MYRTAVNLLRQPTRWQNVEQQTYLQYFGSADNFPLLWHQAISESPSATSCISTIKNFLEGSGFSDQELEKRVINYRGQTLFQIHQKICGDFPEFEGFAILVRYNAMGRMTEWEQLPFENVRLGKPDDNGNISKILYNPYFGTQDFKGVREKYTKIYDAYNPAVVREQMMQQGALYKGQILFVGTTTALSRFYPMPEAYSAIKWMKIESGVSDYHEDNINNGFLQPFMLAFVGNPNEPVGDIKDGEPTMTRGQALEDLISNNFMGSKRVGNMWVQWFHQESEIPKPIAFPSNNSGDLFLNVDTQATKKITIAFKVPAILANINEGVSLGGDGNTVRVSVKLMQQRVIKWQRILTDTYEMLLKQMEQPYNEEVKIKPYNPYPELEVLDDKIWNEMTADERRAWILENTDIELDSEDAQPATDAPNADPEPAQPTSLFRNAVPVSFPDSVRSVVQRAMEYKDKMSIKCGSKMGNMVANAIMNNENIGHKQLKRMHSYLKKNATMHGRPFNDGCAVIEYNMWGGKQMEDFLATKLNDIDVWLNKTK